MLTSKPALLIGGWSPKTLKILAASDLLKTLLLGAAWLAVPDLPQRAAAKLREAWTWVAATENPSQPDQPLAR